MMRYFKKRGVHCVDFEKEAGNQPVKRPDLYLPDFHTFTEIKTFHEMEAEQKETERMLNELETEGITTNWPPTFYSRFDDDLKDSRKKFRNHPDAATAVIFFDVHGAFHSQDIEEIILGEEVVNISAHSMRTIHRKQSIQPNKNNELGAVVEHLGNNKFKVIHNSFAEKHRRINPEIFKNEGDIHRIFIQQNGRRVVTDL